MAANADVSAIIQSDRRVRHTALRLQSASRAWINNSPGIQLREERALLGLIFRRPDDRARQLGVAIDNQLVTEIIHCLTHGVRDLTRQAHGFIAIDF